MVKGTTMAMRELFDTCILIDYLSGNTGAKCEIDGAVEPAISHVTWIEVMVGTTPDNEEGTRIFLKRFTVLPLSEGVGERTVRIRRGVDAGFDKKPKLPDAMIFATARESERVFVTRNTKDFSAGTAGVRIPSYAL